MTAYYNEIDPFAAQWLRELIKAGHIADGIVDERSIEDVLPDDLVGFTQCHFFAGIGGWSYALRLAGVPDDYPVWTGSCPCQPFSQAGAGGGTDDPRHLWPAFRWLIQQRKPAKVFGEQVASKAGREWFAGVRADLEALAYACGGADLCAAGVSAPHMRQRLFWVANANQQRPRGEWIPQSGNAKARRGGEVSGGRLADSQRKGLERLCGHGDRGHEPGRQQAQAAGSVAQGGGSSRPCEFCGHEFDHDALGRYGCPNCHGEGVSAWEGIYIPCADGKARRIEPGLEPLAHGLQLGLGRCADIEAKAMEEIASATDAGNTRQVMRKLWRYVSAEAVRQKARGQGGLYAPEVLLPFLLCISAAQKPSADRSGQQKTGGAVDWRAMRFLRHHRKLVRSSYQWRPDGQQPGEHSDALHQLSLVLARLAESYWQAARIAYASHDRVVRLRGYGNAIVPQIAAEFISASLEAA